MSGATVRHLHPDGKDDLEELASSGALSIQDGATFLGCSRSFLYDLIGSGTIATAKLGRHRFVLKRSLVNYLAEHAT